eukprot:7105269-Prymnesium_polylepis.1
MSAHGTKAQRHRSVQIGRHADSRTSWSCHALPVARDALLHGREMRPIAGTWKKPHLGARNRDNIMVAADAIVRAAHSRQTASRHRVLDANPLASRDWRLVTRQLRDAATAAAD